MTMSTQAGPRDLEKITVIGSKAEVTDISWIVQRQLVIYFYWLRICYH